MLISSIKFIKYSILFLVLSGVSLIYAQDKVPNSLVLVNDQAVDQDDMCIWIHPDAAQSTIISSDKSARKVFVYDLHGNVLQVISLDGKPRNIDVRYNFPLSGKLVDIVGFGQDESEIHFYTVDISTRRLIPAGIFKSGMKSIYGFCLYHNLTENKYYAMASANSGSGELRQWELSDNGDGTVGLTLKRTWINGDGGLTEGLVADDETGKFYAASENIGIYEYDANPYFENPTGIMITAVGDNGLTADIEGITIYYAANGEGYLIASSQGNSTFKVYQRKEPHNFVMTFQVESVSGTDGIDVTNVSLGEAFPQGLFIAHDGKRSYGVKYEDIGLAVDTSYWNPRNDTGLDLIAPAPVTGFTVVSDGNGGNFITASWDGNSSGVDDTTGTVSSFEIRWNSEENGPINTDEKWQSAITAYCGDAAAFAAGSVQIDMSTFPSGGKFFAIRTADEAGNLSSLEHGSYTEVTGLLHGDAPAIFQLEQNYPNPFNPTTTIQFQIPSSQFVDLSIYNLLGKKVATMVHKRQAAGKHQVVWNAEGVASGVYYYQLSTEQGVCQTKKLILLR